MSFEFRTQVLTDGAKALLIINGGGIVALLGVVSQILPPEGSEERFYTITLLYGILCLSGGLISATLNYYCHYLSSKYWESGDTSKHSCTHRLEIASVCLSIFLFISGVLIIIWKITSHLEAPLLPLSPFQYPPP